MNDVFLKTQRHVQRKLRTGECPSDELILDLEIDVEAGAIDIRKSDKNVEKTAKYRLAARLNARKREEKERFCEAMLKAAEVSAEKLGSEIREDVAVSLDETADQEERLESDYGSTSRGLRMALKAKEGAVEAADAAHKLGKGGEIVSTCWEWISSSVPT